MREARGPEWTDWLHRARRPGADRHRHALARPAPARARRDARRARRRRATTSTRRSTLVREPAVDDRAGARRRASRPRRRTSFSRRATSASRSSTTAPSARSCAGSPAAGAAVTVFPHDVDADTLAGFDGVAALERPRRSRAARRRDRDGRATCSAACRCSGSASATSCSRSRPACAPTSCPFGHRGANHPVLERATRPRARHEPEPRLRGRARATAAHVTHESLYDGTVEGLAYPELRARSVQFHPEAGPGPARRVVDPRRVGRGGAPCRGVTTSTRSA